MLGVRHLKHSIEYKDAMKKELEKFGKSLSRSQIISEQVGAFNLTVLGFKIISIHFSGFR